MEGLVYTRASFFGLDGRDICHVDGSGSMVVDGPFDLSCLGIGHTGYNQSRSCGPIVRGHYPLQETLHESGIEIQWRGTATEYQNPWRSQETLNPCPDSRKIYPLTLDQRCTVCSGLFAILTKILLVSDESKSNQRLM